MTLATQEIPEHLRSRLFAQPQFVAMCLSAWRWTAYAARDITASNLRALEQADDVAERAYLGWEIIATAVELAEMLATTWLHRESPEQFSVHHASTKEIRALFETFRTTPPEKDVRDFLGLRGPRGFAPRAQRAVRARATVVATATLFFEGIATFWIEQSGNAQWFRHYPGTLTPDETRLIDPQGAEGLQDIENAIHADDIIEYATLMDENHFLHTVLRNRDVQQAAMLGNVAIDAVMNRFANIYAASDKRPQIFPIFLRRSCDDEQHALKEAAYVLPR